MNKRYFGRVIAEIDDKTKVIRLAYAPRRAQPISDKTQKKCVKWALRSLETYKEQGYSIDTDAVSLGGIS